METTIKEDPLLEQCIDFLQSVGIAVKTGNPNGNDFLPGLSIENGCIILNKDKLAYPGDILHEAGHIAVVPGAERNGLNAASIAQRENREAEEMMAIAWSYAACIHLNIDPLFVFHNNGYQGGGSHIAENFMNRRYFGLPMLQWIGLTADENNAAKMNVSPYPSMIKWLRD